MASKPDPNKDRKLPLFGTQKRDWSEKSRTGWRQKPVAKIPVTQLSVGQLFKRNGLRFRCVGMRRVRGTNTVIVRAKPRFLWFFFLLPQEYEYTIGQNVEVFHIVRAAGES